MTSMEGDSDPLGEALRWSLVQRVEELALGEARFGGYSPADRLEADKALEDRLVRRGRYHRFL